ncbi:MAG: hypothetical protein K9L68_13775 [Spirochaetales bacterium]|nr:hypothetical protein [Spirochaetales bacterium]
MLNNENQYMKTIASYIEKTLGFKIEIRDWEDKENLPLLLREQYSFYVIRLSDSDHLIFIENQENRNTPAVISKHCKMLTQYWTGGIIYSKNTLSSTDRTRLIQAKIPFIIPEKQLYLPFLGIDFKEIFPPEKRKSVKLSPSAQLLLLGKLYEKSWIKQSPSRMSEDIGMSNMSIGRAFSELELHNIASVRTIGKEKKLEFYSHGQNLWESSLSLLKSPVTSSETVTFQSNNELIISGESALSRYSMINEPSIPTFAVLNRAKNTLIQTYTMEKDFNKDMIIQKWSYDPRILSMNRIADPLSVYLEFKDSDDERIEEALDDLIKDMQW